MNNNNFTFSEAFLNLAFKALMMNECESDEEKQQFSFICDVCDKYKIPVKSYLEASKELEELLKELNDEN